jgi:hypothetical protein
MSSSVEFRFNSDFYLVLGFVVGGVPFFVVLPYLSKLSRPAFTTLDALGYCFGIVSYDILCYSALLYSIVSN